MIIEENAKGILIKNKSPENWFNIAYNMNIYRGCSHKCIYCDSRSECYGIKNFDDIIVKVNAPTLLDLKLKSMKQKAVIGTGAMSDPYLHAEKSYNLTRKCLEIIERYGFPITLTTKSDMVLNDIDVLTKINENTLTTVMFTLTTVDDELAKIIEPSAPLPSKRLEAMKILSASGIYTGVLLMPVLPFIEDNEENILSVIESAYKCGVKFIFPYMGVTLRDRQKDYYYEKLEIHFKGLKERYKEEYKNNYACNSLNYKELYEVLSDRCKALNIEYKMNKIKTWQNKSDQISLF